MKRSLTPKQFWEHLPYKTAGKILKLLEMKNIPAEELNCILYEMKEFMIKKEFENYAKNISDEELEEVVNRFYARYLMMPHPYTERKKVSLYADMHIDKQFQAGDSVEIQIMKVWKRDHPHYWEFEVTKGTLKDVVKNFKSNKRGVDLAIDENHEPEHRALGWIKDVYQKGDESLYATVELTKKGAEALSEWLYKYFSPEIIWETVDEETGEVVKNLLIGGAFTNRPFFKNMESIKATEATSNDIHIYSYQSKTMLEFITLMSKFGSAKSLSTAQFSEIQTAFNELPEEEKTEEIKEQLAEVEKKVETVATETETTETTETEEVAETTETETTETEEEVTEVKEVPETLKASEDKKISVDFAEFTRLKNQEAKFKEQIKQFREAEVKNKSQSLQFNEATGEGFLLPSNMDKVQKFALSLTDGQEKTFFEILGTIKTDVSEYFKEKGGAGKAGDTSFDPKMKKKFQEEFNMSEEEAIEAAKSFEKTKKTK